MIARIMEKMPGCSATYHKIITVLIGIVLSTLVSLIARWHLSIEGLPTPWDWLTIASEGFIVPVLFALFIVITPCASVCFARYGGIQRRIAQYTLITWGMALMIAWLCAWILIIWEKLPYTPYPWTLYQLSWLIEPGTTQYQHWVIMVLVGWGSWLLLTILSCTYRTLSRETVLGGAHFANPFEIQKAGLYQDTGLLLGQAYGKALRLGGFESVLVVAPTGGGKTTSIALPNLIEWTGSGVFNDLKGELFKLTGHYRQNTLKQAVFRFAPANEDKDTHCYNPFVYVSDNPDLRMRDLQLIAQALIPASTHGDAFWYQSSRELFIMLALYLIEVSEKQNSNTQATLHAIYTLSHQENFFEWVKRLSEDTECYSNALLQLMYACLNSDERTRANIIKDFYARITLLADPLVQYATTENHFDLRQLRQEKMSLYLQVPDSDKERLSPLITLLWSQLITVMTRSEPNLAQEPYPVLALMDEFGNLAKIDMLKNGVTYLRSYRLRCVMIVQHCAQIISTYGRDDAKSFLNAKVKMAFALNDLDDAKLFSAAMGQRTVKVQSHGSSSGYSRESSTSSSHQFNRQSRALMTPNEIMQMNANNAIILVESHPPIKAKKYYWFKQTHYQKLLR